MITENLSTLKIHKLTQKQYDRELAAGRIDDTAIYLTPASTTSYTIYSRIDDEAENCTITIPKVWDSGTPIFRIVPTYSSFYCNQDEEMRNWFNLYDPDTFVTKTGILNPIGTYRIFISYKDLNDTSDMIITIKKDDVVVWSESPYTAWAEGFEYSSEESLWEEIILGQERQIGSFTINCIEDTISNSKMVQYSVMETLDDTLQILTWRPAGSGTTEWKYALQLDIIGG